MDRKGKQKLKRYFIVYVIFAVFFTVGMYLITKYEENAKATQIALLLAEHPELEGEIVAIWEKSGTVDFIRDRDDQKIERVVQMLEETYGYHSGSGSSDVVIRIIWGIGLLVGVYPVPYGETPYHWAMAAAPNLLRASPLNPSKVLPPFAFLAQRTSSPLYSRQTK